MSAANDALTGQNVEMTTSTDRAIFSTVCA